MLASVEIMLLLSYGLQLRLGGRGIIGLATLIGLPALVVLGGLRDKSRRMQAESASTVLARTNRFILYLRSFSHDGAVTKSTPPVTPDPSVDGSSISTDEQKLATQLNALAPMIAIGRPGEELPELGAARLYVGHDQWQTEVRRLAKDAQLIIIRIGSSSGIRWEFEHVIRDNTDKVVIYSEPPSQIPVDIAQLLPDGDSILRFGPQRFVFYISGQLPKAANVLSEVLYDKGLLERPADLAPSILRTPAWVYIKYLYSKWRVRHSRPPES